MSELAENADPIDEMSKAVKCLALEVPSEVWDDVADRWRAVLAEVERLKAELQDLGYEYMEAQERE